MLEKFVIHKTYSQQISFLFLQSQSQCILFCRAQKAIQKSIKNGDIFKRGNATGSCMGKIIDIRFISFENL